MEKRYELHAVNNDGRFEVRVFENLEDARFWKKAYGNGKIYEVAKKEVE